MNIKVYCVIILNMNHDDIGEAFENIIDNLSAFKLQINDIQQQIRILDKNIRKQMKTHQKEVAKRASKPPRPPSGFARPTNVTKELSQLLISKHKDYGPKNISQAPGGAINGLRVRMHDKLARINNLIDSGADPEHESLEDSFKDMANYAIIGLLVLRGKWDE